MTAIKIKTITVGKNPVVQITLPKIFLTDNKVGKGTKLNIYRATDKDLGDIIVVSKEAK